MVEKFPYHFFFELSFCETVLILFTNPGVRAATFPYPYEKGILWEYKQIGHP